MLKKKLLIIISAVLFGINVFAQSNFEHDTAVACRYLNKVDKCLKVYSDTANLYIDSLRHISQLSNCKLVKGLYYFSLADMFESNSETDSALFYFEQCESCLIKQMDTTIYLNLLNSYSVCLNKSFNPDKAIEKLNEIIRILAKYPDDRRLAKSYYDLSNSYSMKSDHKTGLKFLLLADSIYKANKMTRYSAYLYNSMAIIYGKAGDANSSKSMYYKAIPLAIANKDNNLLASLYLNIGDLYNRRLGMSDSSIYFLEKCIDFSKNNNINYLIPMAQINLSGVYISLEQYQKSIDLLRANLYSDNVKVRSSAWINTGIAFADLRSDSAEYYLKRGATIASENNELENLLYAYSTLSDFDSLKGDYKSALKYYKLYVQIKDSIDSRELRRQLEKNKEQQEILLQKKEKEYWKKQTKISQQLANQKSLDLVFLLGILVILVFVLLIVNKLRRKNKKYHEELMELHDIILKKKKLLEKNNAELENIVATKDTLFSIVSHDLRSPVGTNIKLLELLEENIDSFDMQEIKTIISEIKKSGENVFKLLNDILEWSKLEQGVFTPNIKRFNLKQAINDSLLQLMPSVANKEIELDISIDDMDIESDSNFLYTIVRNIVSNAIKFTPRGGKIEIYVEKNAGANILCIKDSGTGMSPEIAKNIFSVSSNTQMGTENEKGSGFGLKIVKSMVDKLGYKIWVESKEGEGSVFYLRLG